MGNGDLAKVSFGGALDERSTGAVKTVPYRGISEKLNCFWPTMPAGISVAHLAVGWLWIFRISLRHALSGPGLLILLPPGFGM